MVNAKFEVYKKTLIWVMSVTTHNFCLFVPQGHIETAQFYLKNTENLPSKDDNIIISAKHDNIIIS